MTKKRARKPNYTDLEISTLLEEIMMERATLFSSFNTTVTIKMKNEKWDRITSAVNACGVALRARQDLRDKWKSLKSDVIAKDKKSVKTGGGPPDPSLPFEEVIRQIIGQDSNLFEGVPGK